MRKSLLGVIVLFIFTMVLAPIPALQTTAGAETFVNKVPAFTLEVPAWTVSKSASPKSVLRKAEDMMEITTFDVWVEDLPSDKTYKDLAKDAINYLKSEYTAKNGDVLYEREIKLADGTPAYELEIRWQHPSVLLYTYEVVVFKDKKIVTVSVTSGDPIEDRLKKIPLSLSFK
jgi:hypothetical protein